jgi:hypothetical protein
LTKKNELENAGTKKYNKYALMDGFRAKSEYRDGDAALTRVLNILSGNAEEDYHDDSVTQLAGGCDHDMNISDHSDEVT